jgi:hypothetical protein
MSNDKNLEEISTPTPEELKEEEEALKEAKEDDIRSEVVTEFGFDEDVDSAHIDRVVKERLEHKKALSTAIRQKIERRKEAEALHKKFNSSKEDPQPKADDKGFVTKEELEERDLQRDLDALNLSDELRQEAESFAKFKKVSAKEAFNSPYIQSIKKAEDDKKEEEEAGISGTGRTRSVKIDLKKKDPEDLTKGIDLSTEEGRKEYEERKKAFGIK